MSNNRILHNTETYLSFELNSELFAVNVQKVLEVLEDYKITEVPQTADHIKGIINFRGEILPIIESRRKFNMNERSAEGKNVTIVLELEAEDTRVMIGAVVDGVRDVITIPDREIKPVPELGSTYNSSYVLGMYKLPKGFVMILDVDKVFIGDEQVALVTESE